MVLSSCYLWHANSMTGVMGIYLVRSVGFSAVRAVGKKLWTIWRYGCLSVQRWIKSEPGGTCVPKFRSGSRVSLQCDLPEKGEDSGLIVCCKFAWVAECNLSVCSNTPTLYQVMDLNPGLSIQVLCVVQWECQENTAWTEKSSPRPGSADATNCICWKIRKKHPRRGQGFQKCWHMGFYCKSPGLLCLSGWVLRQNKTISSSGVAVWRK